MDKPRLLAKSLRHANPVRPGLWVVMHNRMQLVMLFEFPPNYRLVFS
jgi:hypothetical protein